MLHLSTTTILITRKGLLRGGEGEASTRTEENHSSEEENKGNCSYLNRRYNETILTRLNGDRKTKLRPREDHTRGQEEDLAIYAVLQTLQNGEEGRIIPSRKALDNYAEHIDCSYLFPSQLMQCMWTELQAQRQEGEQVGGSVGKEN